MDDTFKSLFNPTFASKVESRKQPHNDRAKDNHGSNRDDFGRVGIAGNSERNQGYGMRLIANTMESKSMTTGKLDDVIAFSDSVDVTFFSKILNASLKYHDAKNKCCDVPTTEALRRAIALIEAICTDQIIIEESR